MRQSFFGGVLVARIARVFIRRVDRRLSRGSRIHCGGGARASRKEEDGNEASKVFFRTTAAGSVITSLAQADSFTNYRGSAQCFAIG